MNRRVLALGIVLSVGSSWAVRGAAEKPAASAALGAKRFRDADENNDALLDEKELIDGLNAVPPTPFLFTAPPAAPRPAAPPAANKPEAGGTP